MDGASRHSRGGLFVYQIKPVKFMKTLNQLNTKYWYRVLKVIYILIFSATLLIIYNTYRPAYDDVFDDIVTPIFYVLLILEIFKRSIYYIYFGTISPIENKEAEN
jgi:uncharacterized membrane protein (DUF373 family)